MTEVRFKTDADAPDLAMMQKQLMEADGNYTTNGQAMEAAVETAQQADAGQSKTISIDLAHSTTQGDQNKLELMLKNITAHGIEQLREVRDGASTAMQAIHEAHNALVDDINEHTQRIERAIKTKIVVSPALAEIKRDFMSRNGKG